MKKAEVPITMVERYVSPSFLLHIDEAVRDAAHFLDKVMPGWYERIYLNRLDIGNCRHCIIGQLYQRSWAQDILGFFFLQSSFDYGRRHLTKQHGLAFLRVERAFLGGSLRTQAWREEITARRERA